MKHKFIIPLIFLLVALVLVACSSSGDATTADEPEAPAEEQAAVAEEPTEPYNVPGK